MSSLLVVKHNAIKANVRGIEGFASNMPAMPFLASLMLQHQSRWPGTNVFSRISNRLSRSTTRNRANEIGDALSATMSKTLTERLNTFRQDFKKLLGPKQQVLDRWRTVLSCLLLL